MREAKQSRIWVRDKDRGKQTGDHPTPFDPEVEDRRKASPYYIRKSLERRFRGYMGKDSMTAEW